MTKPQLPLGGARVRKGALKLSTSDLVTARLPAGETYPLILEPRVPGLDLVGWAREDSNQERLQADLGRHGAVLLRGFAVEGITAFEDFVRATSSEPLAYQERSSPREVVKDRIYTSTSHPADQEIFLHNEQSYNLTFPTRIYFHCVAPAVTGGATPLACTRRILADLPGPLVERLTAGGYRYVRNFGEGLGLSWQTAFQTEERAEVERYCREHQIGFEWLAPDRLRTHQVRRCVARHPRTGDPVWFNHLTFFHVSTLPAPLVEHLRRLYAEDEMPNNTFHGDGTPLVPADLEALRAAYLRARVAVPWQRGDCLMIDNLLMAHGREAFTGPRQIVVAMSAPCAWDAVAGGAA